MTTGTLTEFRMPSLGADMESGVLLEWLVHPGDTVHKGDIVAVVDTAKAAVEVECFAGGVVRELLVEPGTRVPVGEVLATIATGEASTGEASTGEASAGQESTRQASTRQESTRREGPGVVTSPLVRRLAGELHVDVSHLAGTGEGGRVTHADVMRQSHAAEQPIAAPAAEQPIAAPAAVPGGRIKASPLARRLAAEAGMDLAAVRGSGPSESIAAADVLRSLPAQPAAPAPQAPVQAEAATQPPVGARPQGIDMEAMRSTIAALMSRSKREIPHYYLTEQIDLADAMDWLHERNRDLPVSQRLVPSAMLLKAAARAAADVRELNGFWIGDRFSAAEAVHLGVAISLRGGGLIAPAIHDADKLPLADLMAALRDLVARTRAGRLRGSELSDPTITVSNLGDQGVESILGVIYPPQVALVGFGRVVQRPWAVGGLIGVRPVVTASLAADHRVTDGATGARYLQKVVQLLAQPGEL